MHSKEYPYVTSRDTTAAGVIAEIFIPSVVSMVIPALILQTMLKGELVMPEVSDQQNASVSDFTEGQRKAVSSVAYAV